MIMLIGVVFYVIAAVCLCLGMIMIVGGVTGSADSDVDMVIASVCFVLVIVCCLIGHACF